MAHRISPAVWDASARGPTVPSGAGHRAQARARRRADEYIANLKKSAREGKISIDFLRNGRGATAVAADSTRARPGAAVATPIGWKELASLRRADSFKVRNLPARLASLEMDPWAGFDELRQDLPENG